METTRTTRGKVVGIGIADCRAKERTSKRGIPASSSPLLLRIHSNCEAQQYEKLAERITNTFSRAPSKKAGVQIRPEPREITEQLTWSSARLCSSSRSLMFSNDCSRSPLPILALFLYSAPDVNYAPKAPLATPWPFHPLCHFLFNLANAKQSV